MSVTATPSGRARARSRRARRRAAKAGSGSTGVTGSRSASNGSGIADLPSLRRVRGAERRPGPDQQRLGGVHGTAEHAGHLGHRQVIHVPQRQRGPVVRAEPLQHVLGPQGIEPGVPRVVAVRIRRRGHGTQRALLPGLPAPMVAQLVPGDADQPPRGQRRGRGGPHRIHRRQERLGGQVLGQRPLPAPGQQVAVDLGKGLVIEVEQACGSLSPGQPLSAHTPIVVRAARTPTGYRGRMPDGKKLSLDVGGTTVVVSNPGKVYFPRTGHTKLDLVQYYLAVADGALRGVAGRPMVLKRYVNGAEGEPFFQKRAPDKRPDWIETVLLSFPSGRTADEVVARNVAGIAWVVNLGCIDLNPHPVLAEDLDHPDELRVDLDPVPGVEWPQILRVALVARDVLTDFGRPGGRRPAGPGVFHVSGRAGRRGCSAGARRAAGGWAG